MKKEINPNLVIAIVAILVLFFGYMGYRKFAGNPASESAITAKEAGLGSPVLPHIPGRPDPTKATASQTQENTH